MASATRAYLADLQDLLVQRTYARLALARAQRASPHEAPHDATTRLREIDAAIQQAVASALLDP